MRANTRGAFGIEKYEDWMAPGAVGFASLSDTAMARDSAGRWDVPVCGGLERQL